MKPFKVIVVLLLMLFLFASCNPFSKKEEDGFYNYSRISYKYRLPIHDPYEIVSMDNGKSWNLDFKGTNPPKPLGMQWLTKIGFADSFFVVYSPQDFAFSSDHDQVWTVINYRSKEEKVYTKHEAYIGFFAARKIDTAKLMDITAAFVSFEKEKKLPKEWLGHP
jgi:hypothetical protein